jgi:hypothetical protein
MNVANPQLYTFRIEKSIRSGGSSKKTGAMSNSRSIRTRQFPHFFDFTFASLASLGGRDISEAEILSDNIRAALLVWTALDEIF